MKIRSYLKETRYAFLGTKKMIVRRRRRRLEHPRSKGEERRTRRMKERSSWTRRVPGRKDPGCPDTKTWGGLNPLDIPGARPLPGLHPSRLRVPGHTAPGARAHGPGCPTHLLGLAQPAPGAPLTGPGCPTLAHQPLGATPGARVWDPRVPSQPLTWPGARLLRHRVPGPARA